jgi:hypothetical protein
MIVSLDDHGKDRLTVRLTGADRDLSPLMSGYSIHCWRPSRPDEQDPCSPRGRAPRGFPCCPVGGRAGTIRERRPGAASCAGQGRAAVGGRGASRCRESVQNAGNRTWEAGPGPAGCLVSAGARACPVDARRGLSAWIRKRVRRPGRGHASRAWRVSGRHGSSLCPRTGTGLRRSRCWTCPPR